jgi:hypothetical protein
MTGKIFACFASLILGVASANLAAAESSSSDSSSSSSSSETAVLVGTFKIDEIRKPPHHHRRFWLDNGTIYRGKNEHEAMKMRNWALGDEILVLKINPNLFRLTNTDQNSHALCRIEKGFIKVGTFTIDETLSDNRFLLDNGKVYEPLDSDDKKTVQTWGLGDSILVLRDHGNRFILVNATRGNDISAKLASL